MAVHCCLHSKWVVAAFSENCPPTMTASQRGILTCRRRDMNKTHKSPPARNHSPHLSELLASFLRKWKKRQHMTVHFDGESIRDSSDNTNSTTRARYNTKHVLLLHAPSLGVSHNFNSLVKNLYVTKEVYSKTLTCSFWMYKWSSCN